MVLSFSEIKKEPSRIANDKLTTSPRFLVCLNAPRLSPISPHTQAIMGHVFSMCSAGSRDYDQARRVQAPSFTSPSQLRRTACEGHASTVRIQDVQSALVSTQDSQKATNQPCAYNASNTLHFSQPTALCSTRRPQISRARSHAQSALSNSRRLKCPPPTLQRARNCRPSFWTANS